MHLKQIAILFSILLICSLFIGCIKKQNTTPADTTPVSYSSTTISIASWNLQAFGMSKASNQTLLNYYASKLSKYDIFIVQEIRDSSETAIVMLSDKLPAYNYITSERAGQSSSKEQYAIFYDNRVHLISSRDFQAQYQQNMQRPPLEATFSSNNWTFTIYTIHTDPDTVSSDLSILQTIVGHPTNDTILMGDMNADGSYYDENNIQHFTDWKWVITNNVDTTVAASENTYDRIIINNPATNNFISFGVMNDVHSGQSDHYLVYATFSNRIQ